MLEHILGALTESDYVALKVRIYVNAKFLSIKILNLSA